MCDFRRNVELKCTVESSNLKKKYRLIMMKMTGGREEDDV